MIFMEWIQLLSDRRPGEKRKHHNSQRSKFEQDYDRIIFSHPFRMLQDKTQVFPLPKQDFVHTRLTHSLEVASVGRSLGKLAGEQILDRDNALTSAGFTSVDFGAIVSAASLMHDLGNPPFGHAGESAISGFFKSYPKSSIIQEHVSKKEWADLTNFEGNAQGFRLVNMDNHQGLKLTFATLGAFTKYPRESLISQPDEDRKSQKKYGFLQHNKSVFRELANETGLINMGDDNNAVWCRHPLAFLVEAADDICYNIIDLEDGTNLGLVTLEETEALLIEIIGDQFDLNKYNRIGSFKEKVSVLRAMAIQKLILECVELFIEKEEELLSGIFDLALTDHIDSTPVLKKIQRISFSKIYKSKPVIEREVAGFEVLKGLLETFVPAVLELKSARKISWYHTSLIKLLPTYEQDILTKAETLYEALLVLLDVISGMTDSYALSLYRNIKGISLPNS
jgi:dGTPase